MEYGLDFNSDRLGGVSVGNRCCIPDNWVWAPTRYTDTHFWVDQGRSISFVEKNCFESALTVACSYILLSYIREV